MMIIHLELQWLVHWLDGGGENPGNLQISLYAKKWKISVYLF